MSLQDLLPKLMPGHPEREIAARELCAEVARLAVAIGVHPQRRAQVASEVQYKLLVSVESGAVARWRDPDAYLRRMLRNADFDLRVAEERLQPLDDADEPASPQPGTPPEQLEEELAAERGAARALLRRVFNAHLAEAPARYRAGRERSFRQLCEIAFDGRDLRELLVRDEQLSADGPEYGPRLVRAYKTHERLRTALRQTIHALEAAGRLGHREAQRARDCLGLLIRTGVRSAGAGGQEDKDEPT